MTEVCECGCPSGQACIVERGRQPVRRRFRPTSSSLPTVYVQMDEWQWAAMVEARYQFEKGIIDQHAVETISEPGEITDEQGDTLFAAFEAFLEAMPEIGFCINADHPGEARIIRERYDGSVRDYFVESFGNYLNSL